MYLYMVDPGLVSAGTSTCRMLFERSKTGFVHPEHWNYINCSLFYFDLFKCALFEQIAGVQVRSGYHCAACIHEFLGTTKGGTVRISFGPFSDIGDVEAVVSATKKIML